MILIKRPKPDEYSENYIKKKKRKGRKRKIGLKLTSSGSGAEPMTQRR